MMGLEGVGRSYEVVGYRLCGRVRGWVGMCHTKGRGHACELGR